MKSWIFISILLFTLIGCKKTDSEDKIDPPANTDYVSVRDIVIDEQGTSLTTSPPMNWRLGFPLFSTLEVGLSTSSATGVANIQDWSDIGVATTHTFTGLSLSQCTKYYPLLRAKNSAGVVLDTHIANSFMVDLAVPTAPASLTITENGTATRSGSAVWPAGADNCTVSGYQFAIGTTAGGTDTLSWANVAGLTHQATSGVNLDFGTNYFSSVRTVDEVDQLSTLRTSSSWRLRSPHAYLTGTQTVASSDFNAGTSYIRWSASNLNSEYFSHSVVTDAEILTVKQAGDYMIYLQMPFLVTSGCTTRCSVKASVMVNGSLRDDGVANSSYVINTAGFTESSNHGVFYLRGLSANDQIRIYTERGTATVGAMVSEGVSMYAEYLYPNRSLFYGKGQQTLNSVNFNDPVASNIQWGQESSSSDFTFNIGTPGQITLNTAGTYSVAINLPMEATGTCTTRNNVRLDVRVNGVLVTGGVSNQGGIDCSNGHITGSTHWFGILHGVTAGQNLTVQASMEASNNPVEIESLKRASIVVEKISTIENILSMTGTRTVLSTNWNSTVSPLQWDVHLATDASTFTHSTSTNNHQITVNRTGSYLLYFSDHLTSVTARTNVQVRVLRNGSNMVGAACNSNVVTATTSNNEATCNMAIYLNNITAGDVLTLTTLREAAAATATAVTPARLTLLRIR